MKAGQFASMRPDWLSGPLREPLRALRDRVPALPLERIQPWVEADLGMPLAEAFSRFDAEPLGAASIAQVHRACTHEGVEVAVKVQYPWLTAARASDLRWLARLLRIAARLAKKDPSDVERLVVEFDRSFGEELDFVREARVAGEIARNLEEDGHVVVPRVLPALSTKTVLTMELYPTVGIDDREGLARLGVVPATLVEILGRAYAKQIFLDGLFHADPHPGNLLVIDEPSASESPRVLFVDFGLSQRLDEDLRGVLRQALFALMQRKPALLVDQMDRLGMIAPGARTGVQSAIQTMFDRSSEVGGLEASGTEVLGLKDRAVVLLEQTPGLRLPAELLLYARTLSHLFSLAEQLDDEVDMMKIALPYVLRFLAARG